MTILLATMMFIQNNGPPIRMSGLPQLPEYETTINAVCASHHFSITVKNTGFSSTLVKSEVDGKPVIFRSPSYQILPLLKHLHSVSLQPVTCTPAGVLTLAVRGVDLRKGSNHFGKETVVLLEAAS